MDFDAQIQHLMMEKKHSKVMAMYGSHLSLDSSNKNHQRGLIQAMQKASFDHTLEQYQKNCLDNLQTWSHDLEEAKELLLKQKTEEFDEKIKAMSLDVNLDKGMGHSYVWTLRLNGVKLNVFVSLKSHRNKIRISVEPLA